MYEKISNSNELNLTIRNFQKSFPNLSTLYKVHANHLTIERNEQIFLIHKKKKYYISTFKD